MLTYEVAPLVGAWIETSLHVRYRCVSMVAPLVGAWIETLMVQAWVMVQQVAPLVGAWIETILSTHNLVII